MNAILAAFGVFVTIVAGSFAGAWIGKRLPKHHLSDESKDMVKVGAAFLATLSALVLGLILSAAKTSYNTKAEEVERAAARIIMLDQVLRQLGPQAASVREAFRAQIVTKRNATWLASGVRSPGDDASIPVASVPPIMKIRAMVSALHPGDEEQGAMRTQALQLIDDLTQTRWILLEQSTESSPTPLIVVLTLWIATISGCLGIYAPRNRTVTVVALLCAASVGVAIFLIVEFYSPYTGLLRISEAPISTAIEFLGQK